MKMKTTEYGGTEKLLYFVDSMIAMAVTVSDEDIEANEKGKKIVPSGTLVGGAEDSTRLDPSQHVVEKNDGDCEGVLLYDVDVTDGPMNGTMVLFGFVNIDRMPEAPTAAAKAALPMIQFLRM